MSDNFTASDVKALRDKTGAGMMDCKKALSESHGDPTKAIEWLRIKGAKDLEKKADRIAAEGGVFAAASEDKTVSVLMELNSETDFLARNEQFQEFGNNLAFHLSTETGKTATLENLPAQSYAKDPAQTIQDYFSEVGKVLKEKMTVRRFIRYTLGEGLNETPSGIVTYYIHTNQKVGVLLEAHCQSDAVAQSDDFKNFASNITLHLAAMKPSYISSDEIPQETQDKERSILLETAKAEGKKRRVPREDHCRSAQKMGC